MSACNCDKGINTVISNGDVLATNVKNEGLFNHLNLNTKNLVNLLQLTNLKLLNLSIK